MSDKSNNQPVKSIQFGRVRASIWANKSDDGKTFYSVSADRFYRDKADNAKYTSSFSTADLLPLSKAIDQAHSWIGEQSQANPESSEDAVE